MFLSLTSILVCAPLLQAQDQPPERPYRLDAEGRFWQVDPAGDLLVDPEVISVGFRSPLNDLGEFLEQALADRPQAAGILEGLTTVRSNVIGTHDLRLPAGSDLFAVLAELRATGLVRFAEANTIGRYDSDPNDPNYSSQWHLRNASDHDIDADEAWDLTSGDPSVVIAVIDSGIQMSHPDLIPSFWSNPGEIDGNGIDDDGNGYIDDIVGWDFENNDPNITTSFFHGTHVAGVAAARTSNGLGVAGVAGGFGVDDGCTIMGCGVGTFGPIGSVLDDAIIYAADNGASVITLSLSVGQSTAIDSAIRYASLIKGVFIDCAAGNSGGSVSYPARLPRVFAVAGTTNSDQRWTSSSQGPEIWVAAPAVNIHSCDLGGYTTSSGTSFAAPAVAGVAGLVLSVFPELLPNEVGDVLKRSADDLETPGFDNLVGWGRINARQAVEVALDSDCNSNGIYDPTEIISGAALDQDGDGVPDDCAGFNFCTTLPNSSGQAASIELIGSTIVADNDFTLRAVGCVGNATGIFVYSPDAVELPLGNGNVCVGSSTLGFVLRLPGIVASPAGEMLYTFDLTAPPLPLGQVMPGSTWYFQAFFRDNGVGAGFNFSNGLGVLFQ